MRDIKKKLTFILCLRHALTIIDDLLLQSVSAPSETKDSYNNAFLVSLGFPTDITQANVIFSLQEHWTLKEPPSYMTLSMQTRT